jgi:hypothetical protein
MEMCDPQKDGSGISHVIVRISPTSKTSCSCDMGANEYLDEKQVVRIQPQSRFLTIHPTVSRHSIYSFRACNTSFL